MPCTRRSCVDLMGPGDFDSDDDPDYRESSADEEEEIKPSYAQDRAQWTVYNYEEICELYKMVRENGKTLFGQAFFQLGDITSFSHFIYNFTTPGAISKRVGR